MRKRYLNCKQTNQNEDDSYCECKEISSYRFCSRSSSTFGKEGDVREDPVLTDSLEDFGGTDQTGQSGG